MINTVTFQNKPRLRFKHIPNYHLNKTEKNVLVNALSAGLIHPCLGNTLSVANHLPVPFFSFLEPLALTFFE